VPPRDCFTKDAPSFSLQKKFEIRGESLIICAVEIRDKCFARLRIWKEAAVSRYAGTGARTVRSESERVGRREGADE
jgi:hypothetical protein